MVLKKYWFERMPWNLGVEVKLLFGENQIEKPHGTSGDDIQRYFKKPVPNSRVGILSYNFPKKEWNSVFINWLRGILENKVEIVAIGGPEIEAKEELEQLVKEGMKVRKLDTPETTHFVFSTNPRQLWVESYHKDRLPEKCFFTPEPYQRVWDNILTIFDALIEHSKPLVYNQ